MASACSYQQADIGLRRSIGKFGLEPVIRCAAHERLLCGQSRHRFADRRQIRQTLY